MYAQYVHRRQLNWLAEVSGTYLPQEAEGRQLARMAWQRKCYGGIWGVAL